LVIDHEHADEGGASSGFAGCRLWRRRH